MKAQIKSAYWNVTGSYCIGLQEVFTQMAGQLEEYIDIFAERITHLGGLAIVKVTGLGIVRLGDRDRRGTL